MVALPSAKSVTGCATLSRLMRDRVALPFHIGNTEELASGGMEGEDSASRHASCSLEILDGLEK